MAGNEEEVRESVPSERTVAEHLLEEARARRPQQRRRATAVVTVDKTVPSEAAEAIRKAIERACEAEYSRGFSDGKLAALAAVSGVEPDE